MTALRSVQIVNLEPFKYNLSNKMALRTSGLSQSGVSHSGFAFFNNHHQEPAGLVVRAADIGNRQIPFVSGIR